MENRELELRIEKLENTVDILKYTLKELMSKQNQEQISNEKKDKLIKKDRVLIASLLERSTDTFQTKFLNSILSSSYDTLTVKQNQVLENIVNGK